MDCGWNLFTKEGVLHLRLDLCLLSFCSRLVFSFRIRMIAKGNISSWEHLPSVDHLNFTFFRIIIWKLFQSRLLVWNARKYCELCTKKNGEPFFLKPHFCLSYDLSKRGENKTSTNVNILWRDRQPSSLRRTIILFRYSAFIENERQCFVKKKYSSFNFVTQ